ncbi:GNAT family N-acetyltransferase [Salinicola corii]|uniref:GNAT family N-acetyltransferase n=1 Tax=Salinicola corii TaxID=2606937 RepID=A0A640W819_9GAMM|nr:GNAT family N-acetyltransferase [Salinicola corii]KAA0015898.1 GNAT family N-acetyltransferase [Salinicola corii]
MSMLVISAINAPEDLHDETLRERALRGHARRSCEFAALVNGQEAGLLSYEDWKEKNLGFIYEVYVLPQFRRQGIGKSLIEYGEKHALQLGCRLVQIKPYALNQEPDTDQLVDWYLSIGYLRAKESSEMLEKHIGSLGAL